MADPNQILTGRARPIISPRDMVLDPGPRAPVGIDTRAAVGTIRADEMAFVGRDMGRAKVGQAVQGLGQYAQQLAVKQMEAVNILRRNDAQNIMLETDGLIAADLAKEQDGTKWDAIAQKHIAAAKGKIGKLSASPVAREAIDADSTRWEIEQTGKTRQGGAVRTINNAREAFGNKIQAATLYQDRRAFEDNIKGLKEFGGMDEGAEQVAEYRYQETGKKLADQAKVERFNAAQNMAVSVAAGRGEEAALQDLKDGKFGPDMSPTDKERVRNSIQQVGRDRSAELMDSVSTGILSGDINSDAGIDAVDSPFMTPKLQQEAKRFLKQYNAFEQQQDREQNGVKNAVEMRQRVKDYDPSKDPDRTGYFALVHEIGARVEQTSAGEITGALYKKYGTTPPKVKVRPEIQQNVSKSLDILFDPEKGAIPWRSKDDTSGKVTDNLEAKQKALDAQTAIEIRMADWFKMNPQDAQSMPKVRAALDSFLPAGVRKSSIRAMKELQNSRSATPSAKVTSYGYPNDSTPDANSSAGIGAFVPDAEQAKIKAGQPSSFRLKEGDIAVSPDVEAQFRAAGVEPGGDVMVTLKNGEKRRVRWMDRTANDATAAKLGLKPLRGRFDFYSPNGKHSLDGMAVTAWEKV